MAKPRIVFVHGNCTSHWSFGWAPWFKEQLETLGYETFFETMPDSIIARSEYWLPFLHDHVKVGPNDVIVGWSYGATAAMRYGEAYKIRGSVLVVPSYTDLDDDLEKQSGYFDKPWDWPAIKTNQQHIALMCSDDDPFIPQEQFSHIAKQLDACCLTAKSGRHFETRTDFPALLHYIQATYA